MPIRALRTSRRAIALAAALLALAAAGVTGVVALSQSGADVPGPDAASPAALPSQDGGGQQAFVQVVRTSPGVVQIQSRSGAGVDVVPNARAVWAGSGFAIVSLAGAHPAPATLH